MQPLQTYQQQISLVRRAMAASDPIHPDDLLVMRDAEGHVLRGMHPPPGITPRESAALLLLYPQTGELWLPLTVRSARLPQHAGQVSLPGGATDPEDASPIDTALRETHEEVGVAPESIEVWGLLAPIYIPPSNFRLTPVVGFAASAPQLVPNPDEIDRVFCVPLRRLLDRSIIVEEEWDLHGLRARVPFFALEGHKVWGATALLLSELVARLRRCTATTSDNHDEPPAP
jgi:8-oxo-dGTP pyrophosphatase MutT (NUDIX family)